MVLVRQSFLLATSIWKCFAFHSSLVRLCVHRSSFIRSLAPVVPVLLGRERGKDWENIFVCMARERSPTLPPTQQHKGKGKKRRGTEGRTTRDKYLGTRVRNTIK